MCFNSLIKCVALLWTSSKKFLLFHILQYTSWILGIISTPSWYLFVFFFFLSFPLFAPLSLLFSSFSVFFCLYIPFPFSLLPFSLSNFFGLLSNFSHPLVHYLAFSLCLSLSLAISVSFCISPATLLYYFCIGCHTMNLKFKHFNIDKYYGIKIKKAQS